MLKLATIEPKRKRIVKVDSYTESATLSGADLDSVALILKRIGEGKHLPPYAYRKRKDSTPDELLEKEGIMHLHVAEGSDALIYLVQDEGHVYILEISDHTRLQDEPRGSILKKLHESKLAEAVEKASEERKQAVEEKTASVRQGLKPRRK